MNYMSITSSVEDSFKMSQIVCQNVSKLQLINLPPKANPLIAAILLIVIEAGETGPYVPVISPNIHCHIMWEDGVVTFCFTKILQSNFKLL